MQIREAGTPVFSEAIRFGLLHDLARAEAGVHDAEDDLVRAVADGEAAGVHRIVDALREAALHAAVDRRGELLRGDVLGEGAGAELGAGMDGCCEKEKQGEEPGDHGRRVTRVGRGSFLASF